MTIFVVLLKDDIETRVDSLWSNREGAEARKNIVTESIPEISAKIEQHFLNSIGHITPMTAQ